MLEKEGHVCGALEDLRTCRAKGVTRSGSDSSFSRMAPPAALRTRCGGMEKAARRSLRKSA